MATEISVRISRNPYHGYEACFLWNGQLNRYQFELRTELACMLVDDSVEQAVIDEVMDSLDNFEWQEPEYPLGVTFVGEAACDCCCGPVECTVTFPDDAPHQAVAFQPAEPSPFWEWAAATLRVGAVVAPWAIVLVLCRLAYAKAAGW